ncbi:hypothetical protein ID866_7631, partial [Astraeus odoratus]
MPNVHSKVLCLWKGRGENTSSATEAPVLRASPPEIGRETASTVIHPSGFSRRSGFMKKLKFGRSTPRVDKHPASTPGISNQTHQVQEGSCEAAAGNSGSTGKVDRGQDDLQRKLNEAKGAFQDVNRMNAKCIQVLKAFKTLAINVGSPLASLNPIAQAAVGLLTNATQMIIDQESLDDSVSALLPKVQEVFEFLMAKDTLAYINKDVKASILVQLGEVVNNCAEFVTKYSERRNISTRLGKHLLLDTQSDIDDFKQRMDGLMLRYRDHALHSTHFTVSQLSEDFKIDGMVCAAGVGMIKTKTCLDGTRMKILAEIVSWINDSDVNVPRIFWLHGQAGKGKSAIAHTIAMWFKDVGKLGSCFCFARDRQAERLEQKMFATIAHDMATHDPLLRRAVATAIAADDSLKTTVDVVQQWEHLI